jgi:uncharacterized protein (DUF58 family)
VADSFAATEVDGLRPYRPGTPASRIHWAALARGAGLLERRLRAEQESRPLVVLDSRCDGDESDLLDAAVRAAASLLFELARDVGCGLLTPGSGRPLQVDQRLGGWSVAHAHLALVLVLPAAIPAPGRWPVALRVAGCVGYRLAARTAHEAVAVAGAR